MTLPVPTLDDRTFDQLITEARALIPRYGTRWTDHNYADPGITLLELFAWLTETAIFELDQIPDNLIANWLRLMGDCPDPAAPIGDALAATVRGLERPERVVTTADAAALALRLGQPLARAEYVLADDPLCAWSQRLGLLVIVPSDPTVLADPQRLRELTDLTHRAIVPATLITTRLHVTGPEMRSVSISIQVARKPASGLTREMISEVVSRYLDPLEGGPDQTGWPFGRPVYDSELFQILAQLAGVDHVASLDVIGGGLAGTQLPLVTPETLTISVTEA